MFIDPVAIISLKNQLGEEMKLEIQGYFRYLIQTMKE
jgi:hypothetical protein